MVVADCLQLSALREAKVIAGHEGLDQFVVTVSVLEYAKISSISDVLFLGNELILSAFISVKDSVEDQCEAIRRLHEMGEAGLVLYYVGCFLPEISKELIALADELAFPLIVMPENVLQHRYSEVITEVLEAIFEEKKKETYFVNNIMEIISRMPERQRTVDSVLRILSDRLRCSFCLFNREGEIQGLASWPMASKDIFQMVFEELKGQGYSKKKDVTAMEIEERKFHVYRKKFDTTGRKRLEIFALDEGGRLDGYGMEQVVEVLQMFGNIWSDVFCAENEDVLVKAILNNHPHMMKRLAVNYQIDLKKIRIMWVLKRKNGMGMQLDLMKLKSYLKEHQKRVIVDDVDDGVVAFMEDGAFLDMDMQLAECYMEQESDEDVILFCCGGMDSTQDVRKAYVMMENSFPMICKIFPKRRVFTEAQLRFTQECMRILAQGEEVVLEYQQVLLPLLGYKNTDELLKTLSIYYFDTECNVLQTANLLYLHESTIKYRLNKIRQRLGYDLDCMPAQYNLYLALALKRIT